MKRKDEIILFISLAVGMPVFILLCGSIEIAIAISMSIILIFWIICIRKGFLKKKGGALAVSEVLTYYENIAVKKERIKMIQLMIRQNYSKEQIFALTFTEDEYQTAFIELSTNINKKE